MRGWKGLQKGHVTSGKKPDFILWFARVRFSFQVFFQHFLFQPHQCIVSLHMQHVHGKGTENTLWFT